MSQHPTTFAGEAPDEHGVGWNDLATLHRRADGGGILHGAKVIRKGTFAELVRAVAAMPADERGHYMIEKAGARQYHLQEIMALVTRSDFPVSSNG